MDCGPACLRMVAKSYGKHYNSETLRKIAGFSKSGVSMLGISDTAEKIGFRTRGVKIKVDTLKQAPMPTILHWDQNHFVVLVEVNKKTAKVADPGKGVIKYDLNEFIQHWAFSKDSDGNDVGVALLLEPTPEFYAKDEEKEQRLSWARVSTYLLAGKWQFFQIAAALFITSMIALLFPFLTQSIVDTGINTQNLNFITIILCAQIVLTLSVTVVGFIRSRILLRLSNLMNIQLLSDFWIKLTRIPVSFFDIHHTGDILQRIGDHRTIQGFLTGNALATIFSFFNFFIYAIVLVLYDVQLFFVFCIGSIIYFTWVQFFLRVRRKLNYRIFNLSANENNVTLQLIQGMQEIRLNNAEKQKRWEWENIQANIFKLGFKSLNYNQLQTAGATLISSLQNLVISFIVAKLVVEGRLTFGAMLAIQYVIGQLIGPIEQWVSFVQGFQDAKIGMERLNDIHKIDDEEDSQKNFLTSLPENKSISISNLSFTYPGSGNDPVLRNINLSIPENKVTAIVGVSGSGKTTLMKLLLKIYEDYDGEIRVGQGSTNSEDGFRFRHLSHSYWRSECGAVLQDGYIFNSSIAANIAINQDEIDHLRLAKSCEVANIRPFIESLPNGYNTKLGAEGMGVSQGQKQRILIARAIYKNPSYLFFDEATNSLDANNEREIVENLNNVFKGKTVLVIAHRLSTVRNAHKIVVLDKGVVAEQGNHDELISLRGKYFELVKNQLELGN